MCQVWYLIVSIPDLCPLSDFTETYLFITSAVSQIFNLNVSHGHIKSGDPSLDLCYFL